VARLTAVDGLGRLLLDGASVVLRGLLGGEAGRRAVAVEVAAVVHGPLESVTHPAEDVVTMGGRTTGPLVSDLDTSILGFRENQSEKNSPEVHAVHEGRARVGPHAPVRKVGHVPHELVHDLGKLDGMGGRA
jgi:hypothetical protein